MPQTNNFNAIAPFYDRLCRLVFGDKIRVAQAEAVRYMPPNSKVLIVGGGTGWILDEISRIHPSGIKITYIEKSDQMIALARNRQVGGDEVQFLQTAIEDIRLDQDSYDVVVTPFILDCLSEPVLGTVFKKLDSCLRPGGLWLYTDFALTPESRFWQQVTLKVMYLFFRLTSSIGAHKLTPVSGYFARFQVVAEKQFMSGFISVQVFRKGL